MRRSRSKDLPIGGLPGGYRARIVTTRQAITVFTSCIYVSLRDKSLLTLILNDAGLLLHLVSFARPAEPQPRVIRPQPEEVGEPYLGFLVRNSQPSRSGLEYQQLLKHLQGPGHVLQCAASSKRGGLRDQPNPRSSGDTIGVNEPRRFENAANVRRIHYIHRLDSPSSVCAISR